MSLYIQTFPTHNMFLRYTCSKILHKQPSTFSEADVKTSSLTLIGFGLENDFIKLFKKLKL